MNENVVVICNGTNFNMLPYTEIQKSELNTTRPLYGYDYQVYHQYDYLREHPIQVGVVEIRNIIDY